MRFFGFFIIRWARLQELHARNRQLMADLAAARATIECFNTELYGKLFKLRGLHYRISLPLDHPNGRAEGNLRYIDTRVVSTALDDPDTVILRVDHPDENGGIRYCETALCFVLGYTAPSPADSGAQN
ncbi:MAG: hypothetical protein JNM12_09920 [Alphaproteobacteria bacterium]|nr:hypothetical protein [Alphaproteobacteria bacterium]